MVRKLEVRRLSIRKSFVHESILETRDGIPGSIEVGAVCVGSEKDCHAYITSRTPQPGCNPNFVR